MAAVLLGVAGCGAPSRDIAPTAEPDSYTLTEGASATGGGGMEPGRIAVAKAEAFCRARDRRFVPVGIGGIEWPERPAITGPSGIRLTFRCAAPRDQQMNVGEP
jgi:hypothetical protein